jgi:hypothetical protein
MEYWVKSGVCTFGIAAIASILGIGGQAQEGDPPTLIREKCKRNLLLSHLRLIRRTRRISRGRTQLADQAETEVAATVGHENGSAAGPANSTSAPTVELGQSQDEVKVIMGNRARVRIWDQNKSTTTME